MYSVQGPGTVTWQKHVCSSRSQPVDPNHFQGQPLHSQLFKQYSPSPPKLAACSPILQPLLATSASCLHCSPVHIQSSLLLLYESSLPRLAASSPCLTPPSSQPQSLNLLLSSSCWQRLLCGGMLAASAAARSAAKAGALADICIFCPKMWLLSCLVVLSSPSWTQVQWEGAQLHWSMQDRLGREAKSSGAATCYSATLLKWASLLLGNLATWASPGQKVLYQHTPPPLQHTPTITSTNTAASHAICTVQLTSSLS
jgi:hypothetical protein